jgi:hypothetical protein
MRIRHFGYPSNRTRRRKMAVIRHFLSQPPKPEATPESPVSQRCWPYLLCDSGVVRMVRQVPRFKPAVIPCGVTHLRLARCLKTAILKELGVSAGERWKKGYTRGNLRVFTTRNRLMKDRMRPKSADIASYLAPDVPFRPSLQITLSLGVVR